MVVKFAPSADLAESIIIKEDGSIEGTNKIQLVGDVYTFMGDIGFSSGHPNAGIKVLKNNIVIDCAHFSIYANDNASNGIDLSGRNNSTRPRR